MAVLNGVIRVGAAHHEWFLQVTSRNNEDEHFHLPTHPEGQRNHVAPRYTPPPAIYLIWLCSISTSLSTCMPRASLVLGEGFTKNSHPERRNTAQRRQQKRYTTARAEKCVKQRV